MCIFLATTDETASYKGMKVIIRLFAKLYESIYCHSTSTLAIILQGFSLESTRGTCINDSTSAQNSMAVYFRAKFLDSSIYLNVFGHIARP